MNIKDWASKNFRKMVATGTGIVVIGGAVYFYEVEDVREHYKIATVTHKINDTIPNGQVLFDTLGSFDSIYVAKFGKFRFGKKFKDTLRVIIRTEFWHNENFRIGAVR